MNGSYPADIPDVPHTPSPVEWVRYAWELFVLSDVLNGDDALEHELWLRLDRAAAA